jgi:hypothetical protein
MACRFHRWVKNVFFFHCWTRLIEGRRAPKTKNHQAGPTCRQTIQLRSSARGESTESKTDNFVPAIGNASSSLIRTNVLDMFASHKRMRKIRTLTPPFGST